MKIRKIRYKIMVAIVMLAIIGIEMSCKKLIEIPLNPTNEIPETALFTDSADIIAAIAGIYANFGTNGGQSLFNGSITEDMGMASGELYSSFSSSFITNTYTPTDYSVLPLWSTAYTNMYAINDCLAGIASTNVVSDSTKNVLIGELKVCRALYYFYLTNLFGNVPIASTPDYKANADLPNSPQDSIYNFIVSDLQDARKVLKKTYPSAGKARPNLYTADALLAKTYLYMGNYAGADSISSEIINSGVYSLTALNNVFLSGSSEAIWQFPTPQSIYLVSEAVTFVPSSAYFAPTYQITNNVLDSFEQGDQRMADWVGVSTISNAGVNVNYYYPFKYKRLATEGYVIFRLAEQYLIRAEALAQQNNLSSALSDLNTIRKRAGLPNSTATTQQQILSYNARKAYGVLL